MDFIGRNRRIEIEQRFYISAHNQIFNRKGRRGAKDRRIARIAESAKD
jgi:hypothetical protein